MDINLTSKVLKVDEGLSLKPYFCTSDKLSIGFGRNIEDMGITEEEAEFLLNNDIKRTTNEVIDNFPWFGGLSDVRQCVVVSMVFNLGLPKFKEFKNTIAAIEQNNFVEAAREMLDSTWAKQVGQRADRLANAMDYDHF